MQCPKLSTFKKNLSCPANGWSYYSKSLCTWEQMKFTVQSNSTARFHHQLPKVVWSVRGIQFVIWIWRPNQGLIKQSPPPSLPLYSPTPHFGIFLILFNSMVKGPKYFGEVFLKNSVQKSNSFYAKLHLKTLMSASRCKRKKKVVYKHHHWVASSFERRNWISLAKIEPF